MTTTLILSAMPAHYGHGPGWFILIPIFWILLIGLIVFAARRRHFTHASAGAESVLRERYARGEIDETEYRQRLEVLRTKLK